VGRNPGEGIGNGILYDMYSREGGKVVVEEVHKLVEA